MNDKDKSIACLKSAADAALGDLEKYRQSNEALNSQVEALTNERNRLRERVKERTPHEQLAAITAWTMGHE